MITMFFFNINVNVLIQKNSMRLICIDIYSFSFKYFNVKFCFREFIFDILISILNSFVFKLIKNVIFCHVIQIAYIYR